MALNSYRLGELITQRREKKPENEELPIRGVSKDGFIPPKQIDADTDIYNVFYKKDFVYNPARMELGSIAFNSDLDKGICSSLYEMFFVHRTDICLPEYLALFVSQDEFARYCNFLSSGSAREYCRFANISQIKISLPSIEEQRKIVHDYKVISDRIELLKKLDINLFSTAKVMMKENYREGAKFGNSISISDFCDRTVSGATPSRTNNEYWNSSDVAWLKNGEVKNNIILDTEEYISNLALKETSVKLIDRFSVNMAMYCVSDIQVSYSEIPLTTNQAILNLTVNSFRKASFLYYYLATFGNDITSNANGSAQQNLSKEIIDAHLLLNPNLKDCFFNYFDSNLMERINIAKELSILNKVKTNLLSKLSKEVA